MRTDSSLLKDYIKKRDFNKTSEPQAVLKSKSSGDYMIHLHDARRRHFDIRLQWKGVLKCWAVPKGPSYNPKDKRLAVRTEDHPDDYKSYEGLIPKDQYGAGPSLIWDAGEFIPLEDFEKGMKKGHLRIAIDGVRLKGAWSLIRLKNESEKKENWLLVKENDEFANSVDLRITDCTTSVATGRDLKDLKGKDQSVPASPLPAYISPQLAVREDNLPHGKNWQYERKYDGYRLLAFIQDGKVKLKTRNDKDWTKKFPQIVEQLEALPLEDAIFDGEIVHFDREGKTDFNQLQNFLNDEDISLNFILFDILYAAGKDLRKVSYNQRRVFLERLYAELPENQSIILSEILKPRKNLLQSACRRNWEGIVAKRLDSIYHGRRHSSWIKVKCGNREEFVVIGLTEPQGSRSHFGSLLLAETTEEGLIYRGKVGTGFDEESLSHLFKKFKSKKSQYTPDVENLPSEPVQFWLKPFYFAEIDYSERTSKGILRHPVFCGLRQDKEYSEVPTVHDHKEETDQVKFTNPSRILFKKMAITKKQLWSYYEIVMPELMKFSVEAPLSLVRCPQGSDKKCFYQKHLDEDIEHPQIVKIKEENKTDIYGYMQSAADLKALIQLGVLEFHAWNSRVSKVDKPLYAVFDLDPDENLDFTHVIEAAHLIRETLESDKRKSFVRTTGGKGLHVLTPVKNMTWEQLKNFSKRIAQEISSEQPDKYIGTSSKSKRKGKIFIDYLRNTRGATSIVNFSTRAKSGAPVATPLFWDEVEEGLDPSQFNIKSIPQRLKDLKSDPWKEFWPLLK